MPWTGKRKTGWRAGKMMKGPEHLSYEERWESWDCSTRRREGSGTLSPYRDIWWETVKRREQWTFAVHSFKTRNKTYYVHLQWSYITKYIVLQVPWLVLELGYFLARAPVQGLFSTVSAWEISFRSPRDLFALCVIIWYLWCVAAHSCLLCGMCSYSCWKLIP